MKVENTSKNERLDFFRDLYEASKNAYTGELVRLERAMEQYRGSPELDGSEEAAITVRNITYEIVESQISSDIPMPKAEPSSYSEHRSRNADAIERLLRSVRDKLPFEVMNDIDERYTYIYGGSIWYAEWDNGEEHLGEVGAVKVHCISPRDFIPQPGISAIEDMEYCFIRFTTTRGELMRKYGISEERLAEAECEFEYGTGGIEGDTVSVIVCFYRDEDGEVGRYVFSGSLTLSDLPRYYMRKGEICAECGEASGQCSCAAEMVEGEIRYELLEGGALLPLGIKERLARGKRAPLWGFNAAEASGAAYPTEYAAPYPTEYAAPHPRESGAPDTDEAGDASIKSALSAIAARAKIPYYVPKSFPIVIRKNTSGEGTLLGQSDCDYVRPEQQAINKIESRILKKLLRAGITPIVPEDATISLNNSVFGQVIRMKPGESAAQYGKVDTTPDISQDIIEAERLYDHAKRVIGISDAYQGIDTSRVESGVAKQLRISQASGRLESKKKMKHTAYAELDRIIFTLYLAFADEPRHLSYKDAYGRVHSAEFSRYDFIEYDIRRKEFYYDDDYLFTVDLNGGSEYQREALWERNLENLKAGTLGDATSPITLLRYWQCQERAHYPYARENVEYFKAELDRLAEEGGGYGT